MGTMPVFVESGWGLERFLELLLFWGTFTMVVGDLILTSLFSKKWLEKTYPSHLRLQWTAKVNAAD